MSADIHVGNDVRFVTTFIDENGEIMDTSLASTLQFVFNKHDGEVLVVTGVVVGDGSAGEMEYNAVGAEIDQVGQWSRQGKMIVGGKTYTAKITYFPVKANLPTA